MEKWCVTLILWVFPLLIIAQDRTVGLVHYDPNVSEGYTLITSHNSTSTFLIDNCGDVVHEWTSEYFYGNSVDLLENGLLLRSTKANVGFLIAGGAGGRVELVDWNSNVVWEMTYATEFYRHHHDALYLPNGNILILAWDSNSEERMIQEGLNPLFIGERDRDFWAEHLIEVRPIGTNDYEIVWEWYLLDHVIQDFDETKKNYGIVADHPELVDLNYNTDQGNPKWIHANAIAYNEELDQIIVNSRNLDEFWVIDHSTTIEEASGSTGGNLNMGGDLLYRYGNPQVYRRGDDDDQAFFDQHNTQWIDRNTVMLFNNGNGREPSFSEIVFMETPVQADGSYLLEEDLPFGPENPTLTYSSENIEGFNYSSFISGVELLENGNLLICSGPTGTITEIDAAGTQLWTYVNPLSTEGTLEQGSEELERPEVRNLTYRAKKYPPEYRGLTGRVLTPGEPIELNPLPSLCDNVVSVENNIRDFVVFYPNPVVEKFQLAGNLRTDVTNVRVLGLNGNLLKKFELSSGSSLFDIGDLSSGVYILEIIQPNTVQRVRLLKK